MLIKNHNLRDNLVKVVGKSIDEITQEDLDEIKSVGISSVDYSSGETVYDFSELSLFPNLKRVIIDNSLLTEEDLKFIANLPCSDVYLVKCLTDEDEYLKYLYNKKTLVLANQFIRNYSFISSLTEVSSIMIDTPYGNKDIPVSLFEGLDNLEVLGLHACNVTGELSGVASRLNTISLIGSEFDSFAFLASMKTGSKVYIDSRYNKLGTVSKQKGRLEIRNHNIGYVTGGQDNNN